MKVRKTRYTTEQIAKRMEKRIIVAACMAAAVLSLSFSACNKKEPVDNMKDINNTDSLADSDGSELVLDTAAIMKKIDDGVSSSLSVEYSYEKRSGGVTNRGSAGYDLSFAQSAKGVHMLGLLTTGGAGEEGSRPVEIYVRREAEGENDAAQQTEGSWVYTLEEGGTVWSAEEIEPESASYYGLDGIFSAEVEWKFTDEKTELDSIGVRGFSANFHGDDACRLLMSFPGGNSTDEMLSALSDGDKDHLSATVTVYVNAEKDDELVRLSWDFADSMKAAFEGTVFEGTSFLAKAEYRAFAYGDADVSIPEVVAADAHSLDGSKYRDMAGTNDGGTITVDPSEVVGVDGMVDTGDYEDKAAEVQATGTFTLSSSACDAKVDIQNPDALDCAFASDESVHFSDLEMLTTLNYGLYPEQYYSTEAIADMVSEWVDYLKESQIYSRIQMSDVQHVTFEDREYSYRTVNFVTSESAASSLYAWCLVKPDAWLVIQLQVMGAEEELDIGTVLASYAAGIKD
ncbi:MAG: hypothetical protein J6Y90_04555 [Lachnospiraceae bacterium]|nr:hypothetical protein [Lachnospiraceae bacterium]